MSLPEAPRDMVESQIRARGIRDPRVLEVMSRLARHRFVPGVSPWAAYRDHPIGIGHGQTISQPFMVAWMTELLEVTEEARVLEIGTGSGYQTAVLAELCDRVFTVERCPDLAAAARERLGAEGYGNIHFHQGDGSEGWPEEAPFDRILVTAAAPEVPPPLLRQLSPEGRMVLPVGGRWYQELVVVEKGPQGLTKNRQGGCIFVRLIGKHGFRPE